MPRIVVKLSRFGESDHPDIVSLQKAWNTGKPDTYHVYHDYWNGTCYRYTVQGPMEGYENFEDAFLAYTTTCDRVRMDKVQRFDDPSAHYQIVG